MKKQIAKVLLSDASNRYLLLERSAHPHFPNDPDLPGGTVEDGESLEEALRREVREEIGYTLPEATVLTELYAGSEYSYHDTTYHLYSASVEDTPDVIISWEHAGYAWMSREELQAQAEAAKDTYMQMVADTLRRS